MTHSARQPVHTRGIVISVLVGILIGAGPFLFWRLFLQQLPLSDASRANISDGFDGSGMDPSSALAGSRTRLRELSASAMNSLVTDRGSGMVRMYEKGTGHAFELDPLTLRLTTLSETDLPGFVRTLWSPNGHEVISLFEEHAGLRYRYFDYDTARVSVLPESTRLVAFSRAGDRIVSVREASEGMQLWISRPDGADAWLFMSTRLRVGKIYWPHDDLIVMKTEQGTGAERLVGIGTNKNIVALLEPSEDVEVVWAPTGTQALVSFRQEGVGLTLALMDTGTGTLLPLPLTAHASKCAWHRGSSNISCGVPPQTAASNRDTVTSLDLTTGRVQVRYEASDDTWVGVQDPVTLPEGDGIVFTNTFDGHPYVLSW